MLRLFRPTPRLLLRRRAAATATPPSDGASYLNLPSPYIPGGVDFWRGFSSTTSQSQIGLPNRADDPDPNPAGGAEGSSAPPSTYFKMFESAVTTLASVTVLGLIGYGYTKYYKYMVLKKMEHAFDPGDPVLDLAAEGRGTPSSKAGTGPEWISRDEQAKIEAIVNGTEKGRYYLIIGEKGTGKSSMLIEAMQKIDGEGVSMLEAHADVEIFRIRLGRALDFEYHEDNIGALFSIRGPRDASALLDVERAFNKLEKVALRRRKETGRPLILIINSAHLLRDDIDGQNLLELVQQRAEQWAAGHLCTIIFNSDDYWVYERLKLQGTRLEVLPVLDLTKQKAIAALRSYRHQYYAEEPPISVLEGLYDKVGGRLAFLSKIAKAPDMQQACDDICTREKTWLLNQCWILGEEMDDDVMDQQKFAVNIMDTNYSQSAALVLAKALVDKEKDMDQTYDPENGYILPEIPLHEARQIMTRADFIQEYDKINVFTIDSRAMVRADSVPMQVAFREVCSQPGFDEHLQATLDRISAIESLGRTRELVLKDLVEKGSKYNITTRNAKGQIERVTTFEKPEEAEEVD